MEKDIGLEASLTMGKVGTFPILFSSTETLSSKYPVTACMSLFACPFNPVSGSASSWSAVVGVVVSAGAGVGGGMGAALGGVVSEAVGGVVWGVGVGEWDGAVAVVVVVVAVGWVAGVFAEEDFFLGMVRVSRVRIGVGNVEKDECQKYPLDFFIVTCLARPTSFAVSVEL